MIALEMSFIELSLKLKKERKIYHIESDRFCKQNDYRFQSTQLLLFAFH